MKNFCKIPAIFLIFSFFSCGNTVEDMVEDYNGGFDTGHLTVSSGNATEIELEPGDEGFKSTMLLRDEYTVFSNATLNLSAPKSCTSFKWVLTDPESSTPEEPVGVVYYGEDQIMTERHTKDFVFYVPMSELEIPHTYKLSLTVIGKDGETYKDSCLVFIVKYYYIE